MIVTTVSYAYAEEPKISGFFAVGAASTPDFEGSSDYQIVPFITSHLHSGWLNFEFQGLTARLHLKPPSWYETGVSLNYRFGRDSNLENTVVGQLKEIDDTVEVGGFFRIELDDQFLKHDSVEFLAEAFTDTGSVHGGNIATLSASYTLSPSKQWRYQLEVETTYADDDYMDTYFGVDTANASLSGLPHFDANSGFKDIGLNLNVTHFFNKKLGILGRVGYKHLIGDAADSPIVTEQGNADQFFGGLSLLYAF